MVDDEKYMAMALDLAKRGAGLVSPNPMVGALIVKDGTVIGAGFHAAFGGDHAEIAALKGAQGSLKGATLFVTLEPCSFQGKTPPCTKAIIESGIARVVVAIIDPNPKVSGEGIRELKGAGIEVALGPLKEEAAYLNETFFKYIWAKRPFLLMKVAMSLDGKITSKNGEPETITGQLSQNESHRLRREYDAILVGINTVLKDDPLLTTRFFKGGGRSPIRIVMDPMARIPLGSNLVKTANEVETMLVISEAAKKRTADEIERMGVKIIRCPHDGGQFDLYNLTSNLAYRGISSVIIEGGAKTHAAFLKDGLIDKAVFFISPRIIGGEKSLQFIEDKGLFFDMRFKNVKMFGEDIMIEAYPLRAEAKCLRG
ncbi:MAG: bifunctional diaminohydroxyphosphoribosylaminopyrimidine deaminase/5-amino-6-(5-phosphoribosylamino)uracil reductase RibD [Actinomycetota bacterium]|nr:bifunctional diaminohydroxyphosphoribosylaminopyrimidine deaminase/5-amino-6-(5-phosphoribosylamino)uracil reductase RibD [Actinomycetota bacterium]